MEYFFSGAFVHKYDSNSTPVLIEKNEQSNNPPFSYNSKIVEYTVSNGQTFPQKNFGWKYKCLYCGKAFVGSYHLQRHIRVHTGERPFSCVVCKKSFVQREQLKVHLRIHTGERPYKCQHCSYSATQSFDLVKHVRAKHDY